MSKWRVHDLDKNNSPLLWMQQFAQFSAIIGIVMQLYERDIMTLSDPSHDRSVASKLVLKKQYTHEFEIIVDVITELESINLPSHPDAFLRAFPDAPLRDRLLFKYLWPRIFEICAGLQSLRLPVLVLCEIVDQNWSWLGLMVPTHLKWKLIALMKNNHRRLTGSWY